MAPSAPSSPEAAVGPLAGLRVLDLSRVLAGPWCTQILADLGAEVIKVEHPDRGDETRHWGPPWARGPGGRESAYFLAINRNKRSLAADLDDPADRALVRHLAEEADVLVENFRPGTTARWGLDYASLVTANPGLVYCAITGYGQTGPDAQRPGYDLAVQARAGWMAVTGPPEGPPTKVGFALADVVTGQMAAVGILAALRARDRTGRGQFLEVTLFECALAALVNVAQGALVTGEEPRRWGNAHPTIVPYQPFPTADGWLVVAVGNDAQWRRLCAVLERPAWAEDPRFATNPARVAHRDELVPALEAMFRTRPRTAWQAALDAADVPCAPVQSVLEALRDPVAQARGVLWSMEHPGYGSVPVIASPLRLTATPTALRRPAPRLGEHTAEIRRQGWATGAAPAS